MMATNPLAEFLDRQGVVVLDGAMATELEARGADLNDPLWSARMLIEAPELIRDVHYDYFVAGADVAITASYQASFAGFARRGIGEQHAIDLFETSVRLAIEARDAYWAEPAHRHGRLRPLVAASVGPYGAHLHDGSEYSGDYGVDRQALVDFHRPRLAVLAAAGPDLFACETVPSRQEAEVLVALLAELDMPAWLSFSCRDQGHVCHGEPFAECIALAAVSDRVLAVGVNCTPPRYIEALIERAAAVTDKPLVAYPNSGERYEAAANRWHPGVGIGDLAAAARRWQATGARLIGGCCRTGPHDIATISAALRSPAPVPDRGPRSA